MKPVTVTQLNEYIANKLRDDYNLRGLPVEGEISGLSKSGAHYYFTLKDADSLIKCAIWGSNASKIDMKIVENGKKVVVIGDISPYAKGGSYSLSIRHVEDAGTGDLMAEFNRIKEKLEKEGLFDKKYKKAIPMFPRRIGVVTSSTGAAIEDIKKIIISKNNYTDVIIFPTQVQGIGSPESICENIRLAKYYSDNIEKIDTIIVGRGGGSAEDLASFNDEGVARAIFECEIPIISAVGHESDFSISDFVADVRAETPTAAADMAVMNTYDLRDDIEMYIKQLTDSIGLKISSEKELLGSKVELLFTNIRNKISDANNTIEKAMIVINENNPQNIFNKGYAAVLEKGSIIGDIKDIKLDNEYDIKLKNGQFSAKVISKN